ncbi:MAG TPA: AraC family transcriptional regulator [Rhodanobacteraceae bacterium]
MEVVGNVTEARAQVLVAGGQLEALMDLLPGVVFFIKDVNGRYLYANLTLVRRLGLKRREEVLGRTARELFAASLGSSYAWQDQRVLLGESIENQLEMHIFPNRTPGWCLTCKRPLREGDGICGVLGISRDLGQPEGGHPVYTRLRRVIEYLHDHYAETLRVSALAALADVSVAQLERDVKRVFQLTPQQLLTKLRIESAMRLLAGTDNVAAVGQACGFGDQSAFARQFKATVGMTPRDYRALASQRGDTP